MDNIFPDEALVNNPELAKYKCSLVPVDVMSYPIPLDGINSAGIYLAS